MQEATPIQDFKDFWQETLLRSIWNLCPLKRVESRWAHFCESDRPKFLFHFPPYIFSELFEKTLESSVLTGRLTGRRKAVS